MRVDKRRAGMRLPGVQRMLQPKKNTDKSSKRETPKPESSFVMFVQIVLGFSPYFKSSYIDAREDRLRS